MQFSAYVLTHFVCVRHLLKGSEMCSNCKATMTRAPSTANTSYPPRRRKVVRFPSERSMKKVVEFEPVAVKEKNAIWYQLEDYSDIRKDIEATVLELMQIEEDMRYWDTSKYSLRGIEQHFSLPYRNQRRTVQKTTVQMVLRFQKEYGHEGADAQRRIQRVSRICSKASRTRAWEVGALDQFAAGLGRPTPPAQHHQPKSMYSASKEISPGRRHSLIAQEV